jgi:hypothetical protein
MDLILPKMVHACEGGERREYPDDIAVPVAMLRPRLGYRNLRIVVLLQKPSDDFFLV